MRPVALDPNACVAFKREEEAAASTMEHGAGLLTMDAHFSEIDGLRCGKQLADFLP